MADSEIKVRIVFNGSKIAQKRKEKGLSQASLAKAAGMKRAWVSFIESGKANPTITTLASIARVLGCGIDEFLEGKTSCKKK